MPSLKMFATMSNKLILPLVILTLIISAFAPTTSPVASASLILRDKYKRDICPSVTTVFVTITACETATPAININNVATSTTGVPTITSLPVSSAVEGTTTIESTTTETIVLPVLPSLSGLYYYVVINGQTVYLNGATPSRGEVLTSSTTTVFISPVASAATSDVPAGVDVVETVTLTAVSAKPTTTLTAQTTSRTTRTQTVTVTAEPSTSLNSTTASQALPTLSETASSVNATTTSQIVSPVSEIASSINTTTTSQITSTLTTTIQSTLPAFYGTGGWNSTASVQVLAVASSEGTGAIGATGAVGGTGIPVASPVPLVSSSSRNTTTTVFVTAPRPTSTLTRTIIFANQTKSAVSASLKLYSTLASDGSLPEPTHD